MNPSDFIYFSQGGDKYSSHFSGGKGADKIVKEKRIREEVKK